MRTNRPDFSLANRIMAIFKDDPQINIEYTQGSDISVLTFKVNSRKKASALFHMLPEQYEFGEMKLKIDVIDISPKINEDTILDAFKGNPHFQKFVSIQDPFSPDVEYHVCIFNKEVIQFPNDNAGSLDGMETRVMEDLCREVFYDMPNIVFSTDDEIED